MFIKVFTGWCDEQRKSSSLRLDKTWIVGGENGLLLFF